MLATQPTANVTLNLSSSNTSEGTVSPSTLDIHGGQLERAADGHGDRPQRPAVGQYSVPGCLRAGGEQRRQLQRADADERVAHEPAGRSAEHPVANLAVNPSTGLNQGSSLTITWNDSNTGNLPAAAAWDDQVVDHEHDDGRHAGHRAGARPTRPWTASSIPAPRWPQQYSFTLAHRRRRQRATCRSPSPRTSTIPLLNRRPA